jgi:cysteine desulfurase / selenocysteine lyase
MNKPNIEFDVFAAFRDGFPALKQWTYMDVAARGVLSRDTRAALDAHLDERMMNGGNKERFFALIEEARGRFAQLVNAEPAEITYTKNISEGLNMVATGIQWKPGDNVVVCAELEHPNNVYVWLNLQRLGVEVRMVKPRDNHIPVDDMIANMDARTRCATASTVTFAPGFRTDIDALGKACRERGVLFLVDAAQSAGKLHTDLKLSNIDALVTSTQKGLLGLYGMGFLYVRREWANQMQPAYLARFGVDLGDAHEAALGDLNYKLAEGARRFDLGNYNFAATAAVDASMKQLLELGTQNIERHVTGLSQALVQGYLDMGVPVAGGQPGPHLAGIVTIGNMSTDHYGTGDERFNGLYQYLSDHQVKLSIRRGLLRFSMHAYNNLDDVNRVLELSQKFLSTAAR